MAASRRKGKFLSSFVVAATLVFSIWSYFSYVVLASDPSVNLSSNSLISTGSEENVEINEKEIDPDGYNLLRKHEQQLEKLEELVKNLTQLVSRLEAQLGETPGKVQRPSSRHYDETKRAESDKEDKEGAESDRISREGTGVRAVPVTKKSTFWSERFRFLSAVKMRSRPTCLNVLPFRDSEGSVKYVAVGDTMGKVYVFFRNGDVVLDFDVFGELESESDLPPVTAIVSYFSVHKNESVLVTGHENGDVFMYRVWEVSNGDERSSLHVERLQRFEGPESRSRIGILEVHHVGRRRYILATDDSRKITVFRDDGTVYGSAVTSQQPVSFLKQRLLFLTETGAGSLDLRTMRLRESECEGLNNSVARSYVFDTTERSKAYGITSDGYLIHTLLLGDTTNFKCRIRSKRKLELDEPLALQAIKGYMLIINQEKVSVYNVSSQHYIRAGGPRIMFASDLDEIIASFVSHQSADVEEEKKMMIPLIASDYEKLVILSLGSGYVAMYHSNLPVFKNEFSSIIWTSPVMFFILFLFGAWKFFANKKEALTAWGPDDPFSSTSVRNGTPLGSGSSERPTFADSSRNSDIMDLRGSGLRGPSRRYVSPSRYAGGSSSSFRTSSADTDSRPTSVDPRFRTTPELKYRGSNLESTSVGPRREGLFVNSQVVDGGN